MQIDFLDIECAVPPRKRDGFENEGGGDPVTAAEIVDGGFKDARRRVGKWCADKAEEIPLKTRNHW